MAWYSSATLSARALLDYIEAKYGLEAVHDAYDLGYQIAKGGDVTRAIIRQVAYQLNLDFPKLSLECKYGKDQACIGDEYCGCTCHDAEEE